MKNTFLAILFAASSLGAVTTANAAGIPGLYSTGAGFSNGQADTNYSWQKVTGNLSGTTSGQGITQVGNGKPIGVPIATGGNAWIADDANSHWLTLTSNRTQSYDPNQAAKYDWKTTFTLTGDPTKAYFTGRFSADNNAKAFLNGHLIGTASNFSNWFDLTVDKSYFVSGVNTLLFVVQNVKGLSNNPTGLRVEIQSSAVPVPAAIWLFGSAFAGLVASSRRKKAQIAA